MKRFVKYLLLMALFVNAAHAYFIAAEERCHHETVQTYVMEVDHGSDCGDLCDFHHMFHLQAIPLTPVVMLSRFSNRLELPEYKDPCTFPLHDPSYRPPITL
ncbi:hypothetical protein [Hydrogenimonas urashimensis]|uniref:hypothetical protein n=1 Tax=Hydrogenimonas urashimensis TaxID=2740515 RepID=UPI001915A472|nr:hypothetical protein [Hydrogenimonas urashimensis]